MKTYGQQLEEVQTAITTILVQGQRYELGGRSLWRGDIETLRKMENDLSKKITDHGDVTPLAHSNQGGAYSVTFTD